MLILTLVGAMSLAGVQDRAPRPRPPAAPSRPTPPRADVYFQNCDAARAAGAAPIRRGEPGYRPALDRDNDGVACEARR